MPSCLLRIIRATLNVPEARPCPTTEVRPWVLSGGFDSETRGHGHASAGRTRIRSSSIRVIHVFRGSSVSEEPAATLLKDGELRAIGVAGVLP